MYFLEHIHPLFTHGQIDHEGLESSCIDKACGGEQVGTDVSEWRIAALGF
jgi:hypothetical protein